MPSVDCPECYGSGRATCTCESCGQGHERECVRCCGSGYVAGPEPDRSARPTSEAELLEEDLAEGRITERVRRFMTGDEREGAGE